MLNSCSDLQFMDSRFVPNSPESSSLTWLLSGSLGETTALLGIFVALDSNGTQLGTSLSGVLVPTDIDTTGMFVVTRPLSNQRRLDGVKVIFERIDGEDFDLECRFAELAPSLLEAMTAVNAVSKPTAMLDPTSRELARGANIDVRVSIVHDGVENSAGAVAPWLPNDHVPGVPA